MTQVRNTLGLLGAALIGSMALSSSAFAVEPLAQGYQLASAKVAGEGKCGEGKCGGSAKATQGEGKCGEGKCGASAKAGAEGKCGEGKCGDAVACTAAVAISTCSARRAIAGGPITRTSREFANDAIEMLSATVANSTVNQPPAPNVSWNTCCADVT